MKTKIETKFPLMETKQKIIAKHATAFGQEIDNSSTHKIQRQISLITQSTRSSKKDGSRIKTQRLNVRHPQISLTYSYMLYILHTYQYTV